MLDLIQLLAGSHLLVLAFAVLIFDIPRYTLSLLSLALFGASRSGAAASAGRASVSVILPTFNGGDGLNHTIMSLRRQTSPPGSAGCARRGLPEGVPAPERRRVRLAGG